MKSNIKILTIFIAVSSCAYTQISDSLIDIYALKGVEVHDKMYEWRYNNMLRKVKRVYPYALYAKILLQQYKEDVEELSKKRQIKKYGKTALDKLKDEFKYTLRNMYTSEGQLLMKLIHRETGKTVYEIIEKFRGGGSAGFYNLIGKFFDQDLKSTYNPKKDWLTERVIQDILSGKHNLDKMNLLTKDEFKTIKKQERAEDKAYKKAQRKRRKAKRKLEKTKKKQE